MLCDGFDRGSLQAEFQSRRRVLIENVLSTAAAERILAFLSREMPEDWWWRSTRIGDREASRPLNLRRLEGNLAHIEAAAEQARRAAAHGAFSYSFDRTLADHHPRCACLLCGLQPFFEETLRQFIGAVAGGAIGRLREVFAARYTAGCFLAPHLDTHQGRIAFVINLTKRWRPEYGGLLHLTSPDGYKVDEVVVPSFNSLYFFEIPPGVGLPHFVSHVAPCVSAPRLTLTGWYD
jgi:hypothetical protein